MGQQVIHWVPLKAGAAIGARKIVQVSGNREVAPAVAASLDLIGVSGSRAVKENETVEVAISGIAEVVLGGNVAAGTWVTSDANGDAVATTADDAGVLGICINGGADNDIGEVLIAPGTFSGAADD